MFAVIKTGGKQYKVTEGTKLKVEKLEADEGSEIDFNEVLLLSDGETIRVGTPLIAGSKVTAKVEAQGRGKKVTIIKMKRRKHYRKQMGHRQYLTDVKITGLFADDRKLEAKPQQNVVADSPSSDVAGAVADNA